MNKCDKCPAWLDIVMKDALFDEVVQWQQWERVSHPVQSKQGKSKVVKKMEKVIKEGTVEEALLCLQHKIPSFLEHVFVKRKQAAFLKSAKHSCNQMKQLSGLTLLKITPVSTKIKFKQPIGVNKKLHSLLLQFGPKVLPTIQRAICMF